MEVFKPQKQHALDGGGGGTPDVPLKEKLGGTPPSKPTKVLLVDGNQNATDALTLGLQKAGNYEVVIKEDGQKGIEAIQQENPDIVVTEKILKQKPGYQVVQAAITSKKPVILMNSGGDPPHDMPQWMDAIVRGDIPSEAIPNLIVQKPLFGTKLAEAIETVMLTTRARKEKN